ncbi:MAG: extracellular solute-binding protein [Clostridia bacterium]|nr:extracellular solute-binding protein [Clostridia bacterium]
MQKHVLTIKKSIALFLSAVLILSAVLSYGVFADETQDTAQGTDFSFIGVGDTSDNYEEYLKENDLPDAKETNAFSLNLSENLEENHSGVEIKQNYKDNKPALVWENGKGEISYKINVPETALYCLDITYLPLSENGSDIVLGIKINGEYPYIACQKLKLLRFWTDSGKPTVDGKGNEYAGEQKSYEEFVTDRVKDTVGIETEPYKFALKQGENTVTIISGSQSFAISEVKFAAPEEKITYDQYLKKYKAKKDTSGKPVIIEAEKAFLKNSRSLVPLADNSDAAVTPSNAYVRKLNYIGGSNWQSPGGEISWKMKVRKDGWYKLGFSYKQDTVVNQEVFRALKIDGKTPFDEASKIGFNYSNSFEFESFKDKKGKDYSFYLTKGEHIISLTATLGELAPVYKQFKDLIFDMGQLYIDVIMITGESPDANRDYILFKQLPDFNDRLKEFSKTLNSMSDQFCKITGEKSNQFIAAFNNADRLMKSMLDNPYKSHLYIKDYYTQYTTLGSLLSEMANGPLSLDQIQFAPVKGSFNIKDPGFFEDVYFGAQRFIASFLNDYRSIDSESGNGKQIKIWINWGRDQAMVLDSLIRRSFTPKTGISVNLELTNASLIKGMLSNTQPDLQLHMSRTEPVNLAMRGALYDLSNFPDYDDVITRFVDGATVPYEYKGGAYALPDTQNFYLMFYRKDIFEKLNLKVPETWDEFLETTANIERNNMTVYLPYTQITSTTTVNTGVGGLNLFPSILQQYGGKIYNDKLNACTLKDPVTLSAFTFWTEMYTKYKIPTTQSFYNRFKVGTCPLGIEVYTTYTQITEAAPEIDGSWGIALVPGVKQADGSINRTVSGSGSGCGILSKSENKDAAWEFLKWWTSAETQLDYNNNVESILGPISRTTTATVEAFEKMSWNEDDLSILMEQRSNIVEVPEVPGGYYLTRSVDQAYWQVINKTKNPKDALVYWGGVADSEIARKIKQYS